MPLTDQHTRLAATIDRHVKRILAQGGGDEALLMSLEGLAIPVRERPRGRLTRHQARAARSARREDGEFRPRRDAECTRLRLSVAMRQGPVSHGAAPPEELSSCRCAPVVPGR